MMRQWSHKSPCVGDKIACTLVDMRRVLVAWIGKTDLAAPAKSDTVGLGPIAQATKSRAFDEVVLLSDHPEAEVKAFVHWLESQGSPAPTVLREKLTSPTHLGEIFRAASHACEQIIGDKRGETQLTFHMSPGTPAMAAVWLLLGKTRFPAELIESSKDHGIKTVEVPFDIAADFLPELLRAPDAHLRQQSNAAAPPTPEFKDIVYRSRVMDIVVQRARKAAIRDIPVLIEGESGTGKELFARAIHRASPRAAKAPIVVNCGAISPTLIESELFGHERNAFTGADKLKKGYFEDADGGTIFLDEVGELPPTAQVKLLRVLNDGHIVRLGSTKGIEVNVRVIAATNRNLADEVAQGRFREDLFFRLAVAVLRVPPLRERGGDCSLLIDHFLDTLNQASESQPGFLHKKLSAGARNVLLSHAWPGNVRELVNTLSRLLIWSENVTIPADEALESILSIRPAAHRDVMGRALGDGLNLPNLLREVARHYLGRAMKEADGNKTRAADLVGLASYQTFSNWLEKYEVES
jgi:DNA-binding NtrC family response regulator